MGDSEDIGSLLYTVLKREGFDPVTTYTVGDALMLAGRDALDLFILDLTFESGSCLGLCRKLREAHPDRPVIFYPAAASGPGREAARREGGAAAEGLAEEIRRALRERGVLSG